MLGLKMRLRGSIFRTFSRFVHTIRYLQWRQIFFRVLYLCYRPRLPRDARLSKREPVRELLEPRYRSASMTAPDTFVYLNKAGRLTTAEDWNNPRYEKLWLYNLHYFDDLNAYDADSRVAWHRALIARWVAENPPTRGNGWEPYPTSLRVVNWIKWDLRTKGLDDAATESLALQVRWLRRRLEYHLLGNHLLANAKALIFAGLYFLGTEADEWYRKGLQLFDQQLREQVLPDGGQFERSPMYHLIILEDLLDVINLMQAYGKKVPEEWRDTARAMLEWAHVMCHPDGQIPFFNDAAFGVAGTVDQLTNYAKRLGLMWSRPQANSSFLSTSGYVRLQKGEAVAFIDVAAIGPDYQPGHAHADTLSLELSLFGQRVLVNSGTSLYGTSPERLRQRGTDAHNTVMVDGMNSSEVWGGFRVAHRARVRVINVDTVTGRVVAEHDGYRRLPGQVLHRREVQLGRGQLKVLDTIYKQKKRHVKAVHDVQGAWHLHPLVSVEPIATDEGEATYRLVLRTDVGEREARLTVRGAADVRLEPTTWHPEFGLSIPNMRVVFRCCSQLPLTLETTLEWDC